MGPSESEIQRGQDVDRRDVHAGQEDEQLLRPFPLPQARAPFQHGDVHAEQEVSARPHQCGDRDEENPTVHVRKGSRDAEKERADHRQSRGELERCPAEGSHILAPRVIPPRVLATRFRAHGTTAFSIQATNGFMAA